MAEAEQDAEDGHAHHSSEDAIAAQKFRGAVGEAGVARFDWSAVEIADDIGGEGIDRGIALCGLFLDRFEDDVIEVRRDARGDARWRRGVGFANGSLDLRGGVAGAARRGAWR